MFKILFIYSIIVSSVISNNSFSQTPSKWKILPNSPVAGSRFNDCSFINPNTGWVCSASNTDIYKTTDGGESWFIVGNTFYDNRCIVFFDSLNGWTGEYSSSNRLNKTTNGGVNWSTLILPFSAGTGLCGFSIANDSVLYGVGRYWGPANVIKTTNKGNTWTVINMGVYASGLVDCYFKNQDSGFVVGRAGTGSSAKGIVLFTGDGGNSWDTSYITANNNQWCWKITFPTKNVGYVSLEPSMTLCYFLKTTNGGSNWEEKPFLNSLYDEEGIGFINETTGWIGGWELNTYETTNGGNNWHSTDTTGAGGYATNINRFRFFGDTIGYAVGKRIHKYEKNVITSANPGPTFVIKEFKMYQNYPNPFNPRTTIKLELPKGTNINLTVYNILGKKVATIIEGDFLPAGIHEFDWDATSFPSGVYYYKIYNNDIGFTKSMLLIK